MNEGKPSFNPANLRPLLWLALPSLAAFLLYLPTLQACLVWGDPLFLYHPLYRPPVDWAQALGGPFVLSPNYFRPLAVASFLRLGGPAPGLQHLVNLLLHALNTLLVTLLAARLLPSPETSRPWPALLTGLLYACHPALTEGVAFISGRFDLLLTTWLLLALLLDHALRGKRRLRPLAVGACALLAALSKEMAAAFLLVLPLWHLAVEGAVELRALLRRHGPTYLPVLAADGGYLGLRYAALGYLYRPGAGHPLPVGTPLQHGLLVARSLVEYALLVLWPFTTLRPVHYSSLPLPLNQPSTWIALVGALLLLAGLGLSWRRMPRVGALAAAGVCALLSVLNILPLELGGGAFVAERFLLFPLALPALAVGLWMAQHPSNSGHALLAVWCIAAVATVQLTVPHWRSEEALWLWGIRRAPRSSMPYTNLALVKINQGNAQAGLVLAEEALQRDPNDAGAHNHRGLALFHLGRYEEAEAAFARAAELELDNALYWSNLAGALRAQGRLQEAERILLDEALPRDPLLWVAHFNLGLVYLEVDRPDLAREALQRGLALAPPPERPEVQAALAQTEDPVRWLRLADLLLAHDEPQKALNALDEAERLGVNPQDVAIGRSSALIAIGELETAEALLQEMLAAGVEDARIYNNLGLVALQRGENERARDYFQQAVELSPEWDLPRKNLEAMEESK